MENRRDRDRETLHAWAESGGASAEGIPFRGTGSARHQGGTSREHRADGARRAHALDGDWPTRRLAVHAGGARTGRGAARPRNVRILIHLDTNVSIALLND